MVSNHAPIELRIRKNRDWKRWYPKPHDIRLAQSPRQRLLIQIRVYLQRRQSLLLKTPRWSEPESFWQDVLGQIAEVCQPSVPLPHLSLSEQWRHLLQQLGVIEEASRVLKFVAERSGFREALSMGLGGLKSPILITQAERWPLSILADIQHVWAELDIRNRPALFISGSIQGGNVEHQLWLPDLSTMESFQYLNISPSSEARDYVLRTGGIPTLLKHLKPLVARQDITRASVEEGWANVMNEVQRIVDHLATDARPYMRLVSITRAGAQPFIYVLDQPLIEAGLVRKVRRGTKSFSVLRAPIFARCIHAERSSK